MALQFLETDEEPELAQTPQQPPTLTPLEADLAEAAMAQRAAVEWVMSGDIHELPDLAVLAGRPAWHSAAPCAGKTSMMFSTAPGNLDRARGLCSICPVQAECLEYAMSDDTLLGVFGGTTPAERRELRRGAVA